MIGKEILLSLLSLACFTSCSNSAGLCELTGIDSTTVVIEIDEAGEKELFYSSVYSNVDYVMLEADDETIVGNIEKLEITKDGYFVIFDRANGKILLFGSDGQFRNKIGMMGHSKNEYISPELMCYDEYADDVIVYDGAKKSLLHYSLEGDLIRITPLYKYIADFAVADSGKIAIYANYRDVLEDGQVAYNLEIIDHDGTIMQQYDSYTKEKERFRPSPTNILKRCDGELLFHKYYTPIIYTYDDGEMKPKYYLDFMSKQIPSEWLDMSSAEEINQRIFSRSSDVAYCTDFYDAHSKYIVRVASSDGFVNTVYVDKKDSSVQSRGDIVVNDVYGLVPSCIYGYRKGRVYGVVSSDVVDNFYSVASNAKALENYKKEMHDKRRDITMGDLSVLEKMKNNQNPVIQICTLK